MKKNLSSARGDVGTQERNSKGLHQCTIHKKNCDLMGQNPKLRGGQNRDSIGGEQIKVLGGVKTVLEQIQKLF